MVGAEHADAVRRADERRRDGVLVGLEEHPAPPVADEPVLVVDEERLLAALLAKACEERQLGAEDKRIVEVDDVEAAEPWRASG